MVDPAQVFQLPFAVPAHQIARAVQAFARLAERIRYKALCAQRRPAKIAARQQFAADVQLTGHALRHGAQRAIQHIGLGLRYRTADRHQRPAIVAAGPLRDVDRGFGRAVQVLQAHALQAAQRLALRGRRHRFAAADHITQARLRLDAFVRQESLQHRRHEVERGDLMTADQFRDPLRVALVARIGHHQAYARRQRPEYLPCRDVKAERRLVQHRVGRRQRVGLLHPCHATGQRAMADGRTLRPAGGTRGVDHVSQMLAVQRDLRIMRRFVAQLQRVEIQYAQPLYDRQALLDRAVRQQQRDAAVFLHISQAVRRVFRVQRHIGRTRLQDRQQADHHFEGALDGDAHLGLGPHAHLDQAMRQLVGALVQFRVAQSSLTEQQRRRLRRFPRPAFEQLVHRRFI
ncbi:hypothetical protein DUGA2_64590 [Duganella sp. HH101]|nr:hypothetical protein DUGA2_64590 [Duganella sp. HH101]